MLPVDQMILRKISWSVPQCVKCGISSKCRSPYMEPSGEGRKGVLIVGEAPGENEDKKGVQFVGEAGQVLRASLHKLGYDLEQDCWRTNAVICRPPNNKMQEKYIECCRPTLVATIEKFRPKVIIALGLSALKSLVANDYSRSVGSITRWRGMHIPYKGKCWLTCTYHPSFLLRMQDRLLAKIFEKDLDAAFDLRTKKSKYMSMEDVEKHIEICETEREAKEKLEQIVECDGHLAFDYETNMLKPESREAEIYTCSFCYDGKAFAFRMTEGLKPLLIRILTSKYLLKIGGNIKFEHRWTKAKLGIDVSPWLWDVILAAHLLDNRGGITSLKFQTYIHFGIGHYSSWTDQYLSAKGGNITNKITELLLPVLLRYNALDSLFTYMIAEKQINRRDWK